MGAVRCGAVIGISALLVLWAVLARRAQPDVCHWVALCGLNLVVVVGLVWDHYVVL